MKKLLVIIGCVLLFLGIKAQDRPLEYYAPVPTRYIKPGLSPSRAISLTYAQKPGNAWLNHTAELRFDLANIPVGNRTSVQIAMGTLGAYRYQSNTLYEVSGEKAYESLNYYYIAPNSSVALTYGFFFPYLISARLGLMYPFEIAQYTLSVPFQSSGSNNIETRQITLNHFIRQETKLRPYIGVELYRPFRKRFYNYHPFGYSLGFNYYPGDPEGQKMGITAGLHIHRRYKS